MIRIFLALGALLFVNASHAIAFDIDGYKSTWADQRASAVGDIVTVLVQEKAKAVSSAGIDADNAHSIGISSNYKGSAFNLDAGLDSRMNNDASTARNGSISATITTRVIDIDDYGLLKIEGTQFVTVNGEEQKITLSGFVREKDLSPDSAVISSRIESARIELSGIGEVNDNRKPGIIRALFRWLGF
ncbi:Flagellar L-ring protein precursor [Grimontia celer]|uniref:Flagellar L-ring protein n=1 Tax=Grimontia celer TaxID=1796497 RepID=A0A128F7A8_9GAMM|nr:flagellar basal body L-ring protein FlgH [Grimontia celer]CZF82662.1 Flagellar L-ring protein precursor [Grimontia celer]